ncbi:MAG: glycosyltransferase [Bacilli bacterium]|nr:glycosyltransferase [Bacilli bacterium]
MKKTLNNPYLIISIYLLLSFVIDIVAKLTANISFPIEILFHGSLLLYLLLNLLIKYKEKNNYLILGSLFIFSLVFFFIHQDKSSLINIFKYNYIIVLILFLYNLYTKEDKKINRNMLSLCLLFYSLSIIICYLFKLKFPYNSYNEIGAIISIILAYIFVNLEKRIKPIDIITITTSLFATILIGRRLPLITFMLCMLYIFMKKLIKDIKNKKINYTNIILFALFIICFIYKFKATPLCKSMIDHISSLNINNPIDVFTNFKSFDKFVFQNRLTSLINVNKIMINGPLVNKLCGISSASKSVHMDLFDIFYNYGVVGFTLFMITLSYIIKKIKNRKDIHILPVFIIIISSSLAGYVLLSVNVALITAVILSGTLYKRKSKKILVASYDLGVGGIETALLNFIKNINKDNNEIVLYLESKKGKLLNELPSNVVVKSHKAFNLKFKLLQKSLNMLNKIKFLITNYKEYDFSCCYATYSLPCNFLARSASNNSAIYIHSDYTQLYKNDITEINKFYNKRKLDRFKHIIFVSNESKNNLVSIYPRLTDKSIVVNNFIDSEKIIKLSSEKIKETKPRGKKLFLFVGRLDEESKNLTRLVNSFELALKENNKIELWIVGSGKDKKLVKDLIKNKKLDKNIKLLGEKSNPYPYFKLTDYVILTSNYEGFPVIYGEAITLSKPIITTIDVTDEAISIKNNFGYICQKDEKDIASTIINAISHDNLKYKKIDINEINNNKYELLKKLM